VHYTTIEKLQEEGDDVEGEGALGHSTARPSSTTHLEFVETVETVGEAAAREYPCAAATDANTTTDNIKHDTERSAEPVHAVDGSRTPITSRRMCHGPAESATCSALSITNHEGGESGVVECLGGGAALPRLVHAALRVTSAVAGAVAGAIAVSVAGTVADAVAGTLADAVAGTVAGTVADAVAPME